MTKGYDVAARTFAVIFQRTAGGEESSTVYADDATFRKAWDKLSDNQQVYFAEAYMLKLAVPVAVKVTSQSCDPLPLKKQDPEPRTGGAEGQGGPYR